MKLTYVILTRNRRAALLRTLEMLHRATPLPADQWEIRLVDNGSTDGTADEVRKKYPALSIIGRPTDEGPAACAHAFHAARGEFLILLDDVTHPLEQTVTDALAYLRRTPHCAAVVGRRVRPDDTEAAPDLPHLLHFGGCCLRKAAVEKVGSFPPELDEQAGAADLSFRIWEAGWSIDRFEDLVFQQHAPRRLPPPAVAHRLAVRNHLILAERFLPRHMRRIYRRDWTQRYRALAAQVCHDDAVRRGRREALLWRLREAWRGRQILSEATLEIVLQWRHQARLVSQWASEQEIRKVVIADYAPNLYATARACRIAGLHVDAIVDDALPFRGLRYRGLKVQPLEQIRALEPQGIVLANTNPAEIDARHDALREHFAGPILHLFAPRRLRTGLATLTHTPAAAS